MKKENHSRQYLSRLFIADSPAFLHILMLLSNPILFAHGKMMRGAQLSYVTAAEDAMLNLLQKHSTSAQVKKRKKLR